MLKIKVFTLFPEVFKCSVLNVSVFKKALQNRIFSLEVVNIRDFANDKHKTVDDTPFGGGSGLIMKADVLGDALDYHLGIDFSSQKPEDLTILIPSAAGVPFTQEVAWNLSRSSYLYCFCGRFEGIDSRFLEYCRVNFNTLEISLGNFVLCGGEVAVMTILEASLRLVPSVLGNPETLFEESFTLQHEGQKLLEYPQYTRPRVWRNMAVPEVLLSGNHKQIKDWRLNEAINITRSKNLLKPQ